MKKQVIAEIILISMGLGAVFAPLLIGSHLDEDGNLHEPFVLIRLGYFLITLGICSIVVRLISRVLFFIKNKTRK